MVLEKEFVSDWELRPLRLVVRRIKLWLFFNTVIYLGWRRGANLVGVELGLL